MATNIEKLTYRVEETKVQIEKSKQLSSIEKMQKAKELEETIFKIKSDLDALRVSATPEELKDLDELESKYENLDNKFQLEFKQELSSLKDEVKEDLSEDTKKNNLDDIGDGGLENKNSDEKKSWLGEQFEGLVSKEEWKNNTGKNVMRAIGGVGAIWVGAKIIKGIGSLFDGKKEKSEGEKEGFWNHGIGKGLKYAGIAIAGVLGIKWLMDYLSGKQDKIDDSEDQVNSYLDLPKQDIEKYEHLGDSINDFYGKIWQKETSLGYKDENELGTISENIEFKKGESKESLSGVVPFCIDQDSDNIEDFLSEGDMNEYLLSKNYKELKNKLKGRSTEKLASILGPYVTKLESFTVFGTMPGKSLGKKIQSWLDSGKDTEKRQDELNFFFRQYSKVLTYMQDKKTELEYKIAEKEIKAHGYDGDEWPKDSDDQLDMISEALANKDFFEKNIKGDSVYNDFLSSNILGSYSILKKQGILTSEPSEVLNHEVLDVINEETDDILKIDENGNNILDTALGEVDGGLAQDTKEDLEETCEDLKDDMINEQNTGLIQQHMEWLSYMLNMDESNKETFLKETGLTKLIEVYSDKIDSIRDKIKAGTATKEDLKSLKDVSNKYLAFKKELNLAMYTIGRIRSDNPEVMTTAVNVLLKFINSFGKALVNKERGYIALHAVVLGGVVYVVRNPWKVMKLGGKMAIGTLKGGYRVAGWSVRKTKLFQSGMRANIDKLTDVMKKKSLIKGYILDGDFSLSSTKNRRLIKNIFGIENLPKDGGKIIEKIMGSETKGFGDVIYKYRGNKNLRKIFLSKEIDSDAKITDKLFAKSKHRVYIFDKEALKKIKYIDKFTKENPNLSKILKKMKTLDDLDKLDLIADDKRFLKSIAGKSKSELKLISKNLREIPFEDFNKTGVIDDILNTSVEGFSSEAKRLSSKIDRHISRIDPSHSGGNKLIERKIKKLKGLKSELSNLSSNDIKVYNKIFDMDPEYMGKILDIGDELGDGVKAENQMQKIIKSILSKDEKLLSKTLGEASIKLSKYSKFIEKIKTAEKIPLNLHMIEGAGKLFMKIVKGTLRFVK